MTSYPPPICPEFARLVSALSHAYLAFRRGEVRVHILIVWGRRIKIDVTRERIVIEHVSQEPRHGE